MKKNTLLIISLILPVIAFAEAYLSVDFSKNIPNTFTLINNDGLDIKPNIYQNIGNDPKVAWTASQLANGYGRVALSPTRKKDGVTAASNWMILPPVTIADKDAVLIWEARSLHSHLTETYSIAIRKDGQKDWQYLYGCAGEAHEFTMHALSLENYVGQSIEIAFIATTLNGFILAVDNIFVGVPDNHPVRFTSNTPHYAATDDEIHICGNLTYFGNKSTLDKICLISDTDSQEIQIPHMACADTVSIDFRVDPPFGTRYDYKLALVNTTDTVIFYSDFICKSYFKRHQVIDRCSGTWCNNCPIMELTTTRLKAKYGNQLSIVEAHIGDMLTNVQYNTDYLSQYIFSIPSIIPNHDTNHIAYSLKSTDDFSAFLGTETIAKIEAEAYIDNNDEVRVSSTSVFAYDIDNMGDRYRIAYMLLGDIHDPSNGYYLQESVATSYMNEQYYYQPNKILPEMMYFDDVPLDATVAYNGIPQSLPCMIFGSEAHSNSHVLHIPKTPQASKLNVLAMIIDNSNGQIINASLTPVLEKSGFSDIIFDKDGNPQYFDIQGRRVSKDAKGLIIKRVDNRISKTIQY